MDNKFWAGGWLERGIYTLDIVDASDYGYGFSGKVKVTFKIRGVDAAGDTFSDELSASQWRALAAALGFKKRPVGPRALVGWYVRAEIGPLYEDVGNFNTHYPDVKNFLNAEEN